MTPLVNVKMDYIILYYYIFTLHCLYVFICSFLFFCIFFVYVNYVYFLLSSIYYLCILCNLLVCEMMLLVLYLLGSFVIVTSCFKSTRQLLKTWIVSVAKYFLSFIILGLIISIIDNAIRPTLHEVIMIVL